MASNPRGKNGPRPRKRTGRNRNTVANLASKQAPTEAPTLPRLQTAVSRPSTSTTSPTTTKPKVPSMQSAGGAGFQLPGSVAGLPQGFQASQQSNQMNSVLKGIATLSTLANQGGGKGGGGGVPGQGGTIGQNIALTKRIAAKQFGWRGEEWRDLKKLFNSESGFSHTADNPTSTAYGIPQRLFSSHPFPSAKARRRWMRSPRKQIIWGLNYILGRYGDPDDAWDFKQANNWY